MTTKSTTGTKSLDQWSVIVDRGLERWFGSVMEIGVDGDRWWVDGDQCWWSACDGASGLMEISGLERRCGACDGCGVDGVLALVLLGFDHERKKKKEEKEETTEI